MRDDRPSVGARAVPAPGSHARSQVVNPDAPGSTVTTIAAVLGRVISLVRAPGGVRAGAILLASSAAVTASSYLYNLICIRWLGPASYGDVAALTAVSTIVFLPLLGVQSALAREVARLRAHGESDAVSRLFRATLRRTTLFGAGVCVLFAAGAPLFAQYVDLGWESVVVTGALIAVGSLMAICQGFLQGLARFGAIGASNAVYASLRPVLVIPLLLLGFGVAGAMAASALAALAGLVLVLRALRDADRGRHVAGVRPRVENFGLVVVGLLAFTLLTNVDLLVAKAFLSEDDAGTYASAALVGKLAAFVPAAAISPVLLPSVTARLQRGEDARDPLRKSLVVAVVFGLALTGVLMVVPESFVAWLFGAGFADATPLLAPSAAAMTIYGILNVHLAFALATGDRPFVRLLGAGVAAQFALFAVLHGSGYQIISAMALAGLPVLVIHEIRSPVAGWRLWRPPRVLER
jgi:O-antigen/teichoic acid export membrane protein